MRLKSRTEVQNDLDRLKKCSKKFGFNSIRTSTKVYISSKMYELHKYRIRKNS